MSMTYTEALSWLHGIRRFGSKPGLARIAALTAFIGHPERETRFVHIAGTNGKGSTAAMIESILRTAGLKTGLFVSPYVEDFRERVQIGGNMLSEDEWAMRLTDIRTAAEALVGAGGPQPTEFELLTAVALRCFSDHKCQIAILETGLGGRFDATNVISAPAAAVITALSLDHMEYLGDTLRDIAGEKCGIIKPGCRVVTCAGQPQEAMEVIRRRCDQEGAGAPVIPDTGRLSEVQSDWQGVSFSYRDKRYAVPLPGMHQASNALTAIETVGVLRACGVPVTDEAVAVGLRTVRWGGRLEIVRTSPLCLIDGAHNPAKMQALVDTLNSLLSGRRLVTVMGMSADKDCGACVSLVAGRSDVLLATQYDGHRALPAAVLAALAGEHPHTEIHDRLADACDRALALAGPEDAVLVCGSLYLIGEAKKRLINQPL